MAAKFAPGSFTKNYGWKKLPPGLSKLHLCIERGFAGSASSVTRDDFRARAKSLSPSAELIPPNFFLHNTIVGRKNYVTLDELVRQGLTAPHSHAFDQLALFALHLGKAGRRVGDNGEAAGAAFANDYVRNVLWQVGGWEKAGTTIGAIDARFSATIAATGKDVVHKCATNYHFLFEVLGLTAQRTDTLNSRWSEWIGSAAFLLFDRVCIDDFGGALPPQADLVAGAQSAEFHKLIGATQSEVSEPVELLAAAYVAEGGLGRPIGNLAGSPTTGTTAAPAVPSPHPKWSDEAAFEEAYVERRLRQVRAQLRKPGNVKDLKALYDNHCCFCDRQIQVGIDPDSFYSEAAHIRPLGEPHKGPDVRSNMILLCPEHHLQFDRGMLRINPASMTIESRIPRDPLNGRSISVKGKHAIDPAMAQWHFDFWKPL